MKKVLLAVLLFSQASYSSIVAPWYLRARQIDLAVNEMATGFMNYAGKVHQAPIASIKYVSGGIQVGINNAVCVLEIKTKPLPPGVLGTPGYLAVLDNKYCATVKAPLKTVPYGQVKTAIDAAVKKSQQTVSVTISKTGKIKLSGKSEN